MFPFIIQFVNLSIYVPYSDALRVASLLQVRQQRKLSKAEALLSQRSSRPRPKKVLKVLVSTCSVVFIPVVTDYICHTYDIYHSALDFQVVLGVCMLIFMSTFLAVILACSYVPNIFFQQS